MQSELMFLALIPPVGMNFICTELPSFDHVDSASSPSREEFNNIKTKGDSHLNVARVEVPGVTGIPLYLHSI